MITGRYKPFFLTLLSLFTLAACSGLSPSHQRGVITLKNQYSGEQGTFYFMDNSGSINPDVLWQISALLRDTHTNEATMIDPQLLVYLDNLCARLDLPPNDIVIITSGYRSPETNQRLRASSSLVADKSFHLNGQALDLKIPSRSPQSVYNAAKALRMGGYALYPRSGHVHIDTGAYRTWPTY